VILTIDDSEVYAYTGAREFDPVNPCLIFIHGGGLDHTVWLAQSRYFAHHDHGVLALDLPGHGKSGGAPLASMADMADWVVAVMDAAGVERAVLVGHSMGSLVVLEAAGRHGSRVERLVLIGISVPMPVSDALLCAAKANEHAAFDMVNEWGHGDRAHMGGNQSPGLWMIGAGVRLLERSRPGVLYADLVACNDYTHGLESAAKITCPAHLLLGREDRMSPVRAAQPLIETLADSRVTVFENCGHMLMAERPTEILDAMIDALA
jgi:pimeloyl-ACP methyl ester carboxylesterase